MSLRLLLQLPCRVLLREVRCAVAGGSELPLLRKLLLRKLLLQLRLRAAEAGCRLLPPACARVPSCLLRMRAGGSREDVRSAALHLLRGGGLRLLPLLRSQLQLLPQPRLHRLRTGYAQPHLLLPARCRCSSRVAVPRD
jgi:hypothetical protein